jgi:hypothetical protein
LHLHVYFVAEPEFSVFSNSIWFFFSVIPIA